jgi:hypothetical protein
MSSVNPSASRDEQLAAALAAPPPRALPRALRRSALQQAAPLSFGIFGALFGGFGLVFVWFFFPRNIAQEWELNSGDTAQASGSIIGAVDTRLSINKQKVVLYGFEFRTTAGVLRRGECFTTGRRWQNGDSVQVVYLRDQPSIARPLDARLSSTNMSSMFVALFPIGGAGLVLWVSVSRRRMLNAFIHGRVFEALVTDVEHTQTMVNDYSVYKITFEQPGLPQEPIILRHWKPKVVAFLQARRDSQQPVFLLNDLKKPKIFLLPETL